MKRLIATLLFGALVSAQSTKESESVDLKCFTQMGAETVSYVPTTTLADVKTITLDPVVSHQCPYLLECRNKMCRSAKAYSFRLLRRL